MFEKKELYRKSRHTFYVV